MSLTIKELAASVAEQSNLTKKTAESLIEVVFAEITNGIKDGQEVTVRDFGRFYPVVRAARVARNPKTGATVNVDEKTIIKFAPRGNLKAST